MGVGTIAGRHYNKYRLRLTEMILVYYVIAAALVSACYGKDVVYITVLNPRPLKANVDDGPRFQCYQTNTETTPRTYGRYVYTRNGEANNLPPRPATTHSSNRNAQIVMPDTRTGQDGFGIFYCQGTQPNKITTTIPTVLLRNDAKLQPKGEVFTKTVNKGDIGVTLEVERASNDLTNTELFWRFNDSETVLSSGFRPAALTYTISGPVSREHEGVYEVNYNGERNLGRHAIMRLIVRDCIAGRWGPPNCYGICDQCYNGGVCDDLTGKCICPPGFRGDNCLTGCGGNRFGINCEFRCTQRTADPENACNTPIFCLPDPYGCTCNTGYRTLGCENLCLSGTFGASCTQECHCTLGTCNAYTGACDGGNNVCQAGWSGTSCQIPSVCPNDYFGAQCTLKCHCPNDVPCDKNTGGCPNLQCAPGYNVYDSDNFVFCRDCMGSTFGHECSGVCHCNADTCNQVTGECDGGCLVNWIEPDCQTGVQSLTNTKVNPGQTTVFTCVVTGNPPPTRQSVILERPGGDTTGITFRSKSSNATSRYVLFDVNQVAADEQIGCRITTPPGAYLIEPSKTFVLPQFTTAPIVTGVGGLSVSIEWDEWNGMTGDAPVVAYKVHYKLASGSSWLDGDIISNGRMSTIEGLRWETDYVFSVAAMREGEGGQGPRGPNSDAVTTLCAAPAGPPENLMASTRLPKEIILEWTVPSAERIRCSTGISQYTVYYKPKGGSGEEQVMNAISNQLTIEGLQTYTEYSIRVSATNAVGTSEISTPISYFTAEETPIAPKRPSFTSTTVSSITLTLEASEPYNLNGLINSYLIEYKMIWPEMGETKFMRVLSVDTSVGSVILTNLTAKSNYSIRVKVTNTVNDSEWSSPIVVMTINSETGAQQSDGIGAGGISGVVISLILIIALIAAILIFVIRRREAEKKVPPISYVGSHHGNTNTTFENSVIDLTETESPRKENPYNERNEEENTYANASIINHANEANKPSNTKAHNVRAPPDTKVPELHANKIPIAKVKPSLHQRPEPTEYENVKLCRGPIPVVELENYIKEKKSSMTDSLKQEYLLIPKDKTKPWDIASKQENRPKNRFKNIIAYDHSRVILEPIAGDPHSDYYNACYIKNHKGENAFIASQGPNTASLNDFWRMAWQEKVGIIVMVTQLIENGKEKCRKYWPENHGHTEMFGNLQVTFIEMERFSDFEIRTLKVQPVNGDEIRTIKQYSFLSWPDMGVPLYPTAVLQFLRNIKQEYQCQYTHTSVKSPILVHCSAGVGRTGTFISIFTQLEKMESQKSVDVFNFVKRMRESRVNMVQTAEQYMFVYNSLLESYLSGNTAIPVHEYSERLQKLKRINSRTRHTCIEEEYQTLNSISPLPDADMFKGARNPENANKNRFNNVLPMERNRPFLIVEGISDSTNYINAAFVDSFKKKDAFITTQMPLPNTVGDIWRMIWDWKCCSIVMLNELDESDATSVRYWPNDFSSITFGPLVVDSISSESTEYYTCRKLKLTNIYEPSNPVTLNQFALHAWPANQDKPDSPLCLLSLLDAVENWQKESPSKGPVVVQCINGIGRSGVFCSIATVREKLKRDDEVDIFQAIKRLRMNHPQMLESLEQYMLCYETMEEFFTQFDDYANFR